MVTLAKELSVLMMKKCNLMVPASQPDAQMVISEIKMANANHANHILIQVLKETHAFKTTAVITNI